MSRPLRVTGSRADRRQAIPMLQWSARSPSHRPALVSMAECIPPPTTPVSAHSAVLRPRPPLSPPVFPGRRLADVQLDLSHRPACAIPARSHRSSWAVVAEKCSKNTHRGPVSFGHCLCVDRQGQAWVRVPESSLSDLKVNARVHECRSRGSAKRVEADALKPGCLTDRHPDPVRQLSTRSSSTGSLVFPGITINQLPGPASPDAGSP